MSTARLVLKQPTGWFAAGREVAQALALLSDGAFKLYIHLCLEADRHTGRAVIEPASLTQTLRKDPASIESSLGELHLNKVCERRGESDRNLRPLLAVSKSRHERSRSGSRLRPASTTGFSEAGMCALRIHGGRRKAGSESLPTRRGIGSSAPGHLVRMRAQVRGHAERSNTAAHHQPGVFRLLDR